MLNEIIKDTETRMQKCHESFKIQINKIYIGRISPSILDNIKIKNFNKESYTPLRYLANIITETAQTLIITVFDPTIVKHIEKTIINSDLNLNTSSHGNIIRVHSPTLTEERRKQLIKSVHNEAEKTKISVRNIRRSINDQIKKSVKNKTLSEEKEHYLQNKIQTLTNIWIETINETVKNKEKKLKNS